MWKLKVAHSNGPFSQWLHSTNNYIGRQTWEFDPSAGTEEERAQVERARDEFHLNRFHNRTSQDALMQLQMLEENKDKFDLSIPLVKIGANEDVSYDAVTATLKKATRFVSMMQTSDGHWAGELAGPCFFMPPLVFTLYITGMLDAIFSPEHKKEILRYMYCHQNEDGGWGFHIEGPSTMFGTTLNYICMRMLGESPGSSENDACARGCQWIRDHGGATSIPSWGKTWLSILGLYEWAGCTPLPPEFWILPTWLPFHPGKMWCYMRSVYMPMSYLYGKKIVAPITDLILELRKELHVQNYHDISWASMRNVCAKEDLYYPRPFVQNLIWNSLYVCVEPLLRCWPFSKLREKALKVTMKHLHYEDEISRYITVGSVPKVLCMLACWVEDPNSDAFKKHLARVEDYLWVAEDGMRMQGLGTQTWGTSFAIHALLSSNLHDEVWNTLKKGHDFLIQSQVKDNPFGDFASMYRHISKGSWTLADQDHGLQVSDCTAEALHVCLMLSQMPHEFVGQKMESERFYDAVNFILSLQSESGGWAAWEPVKASGWFERLNPSEMFQDIVVEYTYVECTTSAIMALGEFRKLYPKHRGNEIEDSIHKGVNYIEENQKLDGSWYGNWGICFLYGTMFALRGLAAAGKNYNNSYTIQKGCEFLISKQFSSGGWGESYRSCSEKVFVPSEGNKVDVVHTAWGLLGLISGGQMERDVSPLHHAAKVLINNQMESGDFPQQNLNGVYLRNSMLNFAVYRNIFPLWALGEYQTNCFSSQNC